MPRCECPRGYRLVVRHVGPVLEARVLDEAGELAASAWAAETPGALVFDRVVTEPEHQRKGLGRLMMSGLQAAKRDPASLDLLVATEQGRRLYESLGWRVRSPFATAAFVPSEKPSPSRTMALGV